MFICETCVCSYSQRNIVTLRWETGEEKVLTEYAFSELSRPIAATDCIIKTQEDGEDYFQQYVWQKTYSNILVCQYCPPKIQDIIGKYIPIRDLQLIIMEYMPIPLPVNQISHHTHKNKKQRLI